MATRLHVFVGQEDSRYRQPYQRNRVATTTGICLCEVFRGYHLSAEYRSNGNALLEGHMVS